MTHEVWSEGNMGDITQIMPIYISIKPGVIENIHIGVSCSLEEIKLYTRLFQEFWDVFVWSYEEMPDIDPSIVMHEILTYPHAKPILRRLHQCTLEKWPPSRVKLKNFLKLALFIRSLLQIGCRILYW